jgi:hypothetical protein
VREAMIRPLAPARAKAREMWYPRPFPAPVISATKGVGSVCWEGSVGPSAWVYKPVSASNTS